MQGVANHNSRLYLPEVTCDSLNHQSKSSPSPPIPQVVLCNTSKHFSLGYTRRNSKADPFQLAAQQHRHLCTILRHLSIMAELENANPTILSVSELPSHRQRRQEKIDGSKKHGIKAILLAKPSYSLDPYYMSDFSDSDSDDSVAEPIDEREIYGK